MSSDDARVRELEQTVHELMHEVDRYRTGLEDALQQIDWCIGYFTGCNKPAIAKSLGANRSYIRKHLMNRAEQETPTSADAGKATS